MSLGAASLRSTRRPKTFSSEVAARPVMPQGTIKSKKRKSVAVLNANPCEVTHRLMCTPMAPIFSAALLSVATQTPVSKIRASPDHHFFQHAHVPNHVPAYCAEVQHRISHNLPRPVVRNIPAAIGGVKLHALLLQNSVRRQQMLAAAVAAERNHVRMLAEEQYVADRVRLPRCDKPLLQRERIREANQSQVDNVT
jgi:hypothetical protein